MIFLVLCFMQLWQNLYMETPPYHALSLKEMGAVPGGAFRAFWEPVYRMSISASVIRGRLYYTQAHGSRWRYLILHHCLTLLVHKNWCCTKRCNCVNQEEAVMSARNMTVSSEKYDIIFGNYMKICIFWCVWGSLPADVSNAIHWVTEASRGLSMCEEKQDRLVFRYGLQEDDSYDRLMWLPDIVTDYIQSFIQLNSSAIAS